MVRGLFASGDTMPLPLPFSLCASGLLADRTAPRARKAAKRRAV